MSFIALFKPIFLITFFGRSYLYLPIPLVCIYLTKPTKKGPKIIYLAARADFGLDFICFCSASSSCFSLSAFFMANNLSRWLFRNSVRFDNSSGSISSPAGSLKTAEGAETTGKTQFKKLLNKLWLKLHMFNLQCMIKSFSKKGTYVRNKQWTEQNWPTHT